MTLPLLARLAGPVSVLAGALMVTAQVAMLVSFDPADRLATLSNPLYLPIMAIYLLGFCVLLVALVAIHDRQAHGAGAFGLLAFVAALIGTTLLAGDHWFDTFAGPWLADAAPALLAGPVAHEVLTTAAVTSYGLFAAGWILYGIFTLRAGVIPAPISIALIAGGAAGFLALSAPFGIPLGLAMVALGAWLTRAGSLAAAVAEPAAS